MQVDCIIYMAPLVYMVPKVNLKNKRERRQVLALGSL